MRQDEYGNVHRLSEDEFKVHVGLIVGGIAGGVVGLLGSICVYVFWPSPWTFCHDGLTLGCRPCPLGASCSDGTLSCDPDMRLVDSVCIPDTEAGSFAVEAARAVALKLRRLRGAAQCNDTLTEEYYTWNMSQAEAYASSWSQAHHSFFPGSWRIVEEFIFPSALLGDMGVEVAAGGKLRAQVDWAERKPACVLQHVWLRYGQPLLVAATAWVACMALAWAWGRLSRSVQPKVAVA
mmetsp:Transcript_66281/g.176829  ORF Transcript_66281/g.176829 Transcript_66281/m.176829 type:complete len:236 (-) Transcript_66281:4-711(-)